MTLGVTSRNGDRAPGTMPRASTWNGSDPNHSALRLAVSIGSNGGPLPSGLDVDVVFPLPLPFGFVDEACGRSASKWRLHLTID